MACEAPWSGPLSRCLCGTTYLCSVILLLGGRNLPEIYPLTPSVPACCRYFAFLSILVSKKDFFLVIFLYSYTFPGSVLMGGGVSSGPVKYLYNVLRGQINSKGRQWNTSQNLYINKNAQVWGWIIQELLHRLAESIEWFQEQCLLNAWLYCFKFALCVSDWL